MMATGAPDAVFSVLPSGEIFGSSRDAIREYYGRLLAPVNPGFVAKIVRRIEEGSFVVDHEEFYEEGTRSSVRPAIWIYWVRDGPIRQAWRLREVPNNHATAIGQRSAGRHISGIDFADVLKVARAKGIQFAALRGPRRCNGCPQGARP